MPGVDFAENEVCTDNGLLPLLVLPEEAYAVLLARAHRLGGMFGVSCDAEETLGGTPGVPPEVLPGVPS